jgi:hypothetical protein
LLHNLERIAATVHGLELDPLPSMGKLVEFRNAGSKPEQIAKMASTGRENMTQETGDEGLEKSEVLEDVLQEEGISPEVDEPQQ